MQELAPTQPAGAPRRLASEDQGRRLRALGLVAPGLQRDARRALAELDVEAEFQSDAMLVAARIGSSYPDLLLVDSDAPGSHAELARFTRRLQPRVRVLALTFYWSEREETLREVADALLYKPPRAAEWQAALRRIGIETPGGVRR